MKKLNKANVAERLVKMGYESDVMELISANYNFVVWSMVGKERLTVNEVAKRIYAIGC